MQRFISLTLFLKAALLIQAQSSASRTLPLRFINAQSKQNITLSADSVLLQQNNQPRRLGSDKLLRQEKAVDTLEIKAPSYKKQRYILRWDTLTQSVLSVFLIPEQWELDTAVIQASSFTQKADRIIFKVGKELAQNATRLSDLLIRTPMITLSGEDEVYVGISKKVLFFVDGVETSGMASVKNLSPKNIKSIEVVTYPSVAFSQYDALIYITTNKDYYDVNLTLQVGNRNQNMIVLNTSAKSGKFYASLEAFYAFRNNTSRSETLLTQKDLPQVSIQENNMTRQNTVNLTARFSYQFNKKNVLNAYSDITYYTLQSAIRTRIPDRIDTSFSSERAFTTGAATLSYQHNRSKEEYFRISLQYTPGLQQLRTLPNPNDNTYFNHNWTLKAFYEGSFFEKEKSSLNYTIGADYNERRTPNTFTADNSEQKQTLFFTERTPAVFAALEYNYAALTLIGDLKYLYYYRHINASDPIPLYQAHTPIPRLNISYALNDNNYLKFSYKYGLDLPDISYLNPFVNKADFINNTSGNAVLESAPYHSVSLSFSRNNPKGFLDLSLRGYYSGKEFSDLSSNTPLPHILQASPINAQYSSYRAQINFSRQFGKKAAHSFSLFAAAGPSFIRYRTFFNRQINLYLSASLSLYLFKNTYMDIYVRYLQPQVLLQGHKINNLFNYLNLRTTIKKIVTLSFFTNNPLNFGAFDYTFINTPDIKQRITRRYNYQTYELNIQVNLFQGEKQRAASIGPIENEEFKRKN